MVTGDKILCRIINNKAYIGLETSTPYHFELYKKGFSTLWSIVLFKHFSIPFQANQAFKYIPLHQTKLTDMGRAPCCDKANVKKGPWSPEEDAKLKEYIQKHGTGGNWIALPQKAGTCSLHVFVFVFPCKSSEFLFFIAVNCNFLAQV